MTRSACLFITALTALAQLGSAQTPQASDSIPTIHLQTTLTLVDGIAEGENKETHNLELLTTLQKTDFRLFDNGHEVEIHSFDSGVSTRPIVLWLIVQCNMGFPADWASGFLRGKTQYLRPALQHLNKDDLIGVAHWCDDGQSRIDVAPGTDVNAALEGVEEILGGKKIEGEARTGEMAMQRMIRSVDESTRTSKPPHAVGLQIRPEMDNSRLPVFLFLYGDHSGTLAAEASSILSDILESSGMAFGLSTAKPIWDMPLADVPGRTENLVHYYSMNTGGQYYSTANPQLFAPTLDYIITQLHLRYTLGFKPSVLDGKMHELRVELTKDAQHRFLKTMLRFRREYIPLPTQ
jgi:hypothetical protein